MGTRCNLYITDTKGNRLWLYRHWDGYPSETGVDIAQTLKKIKPGWRSFSELANALLDKRYEKQGYDIKARPIYEVTDAEHGDIEWRYDIRVSARGTHVTVRERKWVSDGVEWTDHGRLTEKQFRSYCAKDLVEARKRIKAYKAKQRAA